MSLYSDLNEILTPYANKINDLAASDDQIKADIGDLDELETTDKSSIVSAINEAAQSGGGSGGGLTRNFILALQGILSEAIYGVDQTTAIENLIAYADSEDIPEGMSTSYESQVSNGTMTITLDGSEAELETTVSGSMMFINIQGA